MHPQPLTQRFWAKVDRRHPSGCWVWTASTTKRGYGCFCLGAHARPRQVGTHRFAWEIVNGPIPSGMAVLHRCDNPRCVRPSHLFLGTQGDNVRDMIAKGRQRGGAKRQWGEFNNGAKLTEAQVRRIKHMFRDGVRQAEITRATGASRSNVWCIVRGKSWRHVLI